MKTPALPLLSDSGERVASRRAVLRLCGLAAIGAAIPRSLRASTYPWTTTSDYAPSVWKERTTIFVREVVPNDVVPAVLRYVSGARCVTASSPRSFSDQFASPVRFVLRIEPIVTRYEDCTFEIDELPYYDRMNPCRRTKDLNAAEIARLLEPSERAYYGGIMSPCSERRALTADDRDLYERTAAREYHVDRAAYTPQYVRNFTNGKNSYLGFGVTRNDGAPSQLPPKNVFLSSFDVS